MSRVTKTKLSTKAFVHLAPDLEHVKLTTYKYRQTVLRAFVFIGPIFTLNFFLTNI